MIMGATFMGATFMGATFTIAPLLSDGYRPSGPRNNKSEELSDLIDQFGDRLNDEIRILLHDVMVIPFGDHHTVVL